MYAEFYSIVQNGILYRSRIRSFSPTKAAESPLTAVFWVQHTLSLRSKVISQPLNPSLIAENLCHHERYYLGARFKAVMGPWRFHALSKFPRVDRDLRIYHLEAGLKCWADKADVSGV